MSLKLLACLASAWVVACSKGNSVDDTTLGYRLPEGETHLTVPFPAIPPSKSFEGRPAMTMRIPREYVRFQTVLSKHGQIYQVPLQIELPGPTPWQERPWLKGKKGTPEWDEFMKGWIGKFIVTVGSGSGVGGRGLFLNSINHENTLLRTDLLADGEAYGLVRYSPKRCYTDEDLKDPQLKAFLDAKPADDRAHEANCRLERRAAVYFSPLSITDPEKVIFIRCADASCHASFDFSGTGAAMSFRQDRLNRWPEIIGPARELLHSFIVRDVPGDASSSHPAAMAPSSR